MEKKLWFRWSPLVGYWAKLEQGDFPLRILKWQCTSDFNVVCVLWKWTLERCLTCFVSFIGSYSWAWWSPRHKILRCWDLLSLWWGQVLKQLEDDVLCKELSTDAEHPAEIPLSLNYGNQQLDEGTPTWWNEYQLELLIPECFLSLRFAGRHACLKWEG